MGSLLVIASARDLRRRAFLDRSRLRKPRLHEAPRHWPCPSRHTTGTVYRLLDCDRLHAGWHHRRSAFVTLQAHRSMFRGRRQTNLRLFTVNRYWAASVDAYRGSAGEGRRSATSGTIALPSATWQRVKTRHKEAWRRALASRGVSTLGYNSTRTQGSRRDGGDGAGTKCNFGEWGLDCVPNRRRILS